MRKYVTQFVALERNAEKGIPGHMAEAYRAYRAGRLDEFYAPSSSTTPSSSAGSSGRARHRHAAAGPAAALGSGFGRPRSGAPRVARSVDDAAAFAAEFSALQEADLGLALAARVGGLERRLAHLERAARSRRAPGRAVTRAWQRLLAFVPTRRAALALFVDRVRRVLDRVARLADGQGPGHVGLPRLLPSALRLGAAALRAPGLPHAAHADRRRPATRRRRDLAPRARVRAAVRRLDPRVERDGAHFGRIPALFSALLLLVYPAYATLYHQASSDAVFATGLAVWALLLVRALERLRPGASSRWASGWPPSFSSGPRTRCCCRGVSRRSSRTSRGGGGSPRRASCCGSARCSSAAGRCTTDSLRRHDRRPRRSRLGSLPPGVHVQRDDLARRTATPRATRRR